MSGGLLLSPSYAEDIIYPAYQDRLGFKSMGLRAGVVGAQDFKISAGSGLQVNVKSGKAFIEQTKAKQESENTFYNGLYNVLNPAEQNPYNTVEIPTTNPQIAQIILRVYDKEELGISGSTYARIEWLNGTANAGATKAHVEEEKASEYGAAELPQSSYKIAYVIVPKNATKSSEYEIFDKRRLSCSWPLSLRECSRSLIAENCELIKSTGSIIVTLPPPVLNYIVGVLANSWNTTIKTGFEGGLIYGDFIEGKESIVLIGNQHVLLQADGQQWNIIAGEPKRENSYTLKSITKTEAEAGFVPSFTRNALVIVIMASTETSKAIEWEFEVGGVKLGLMGAASGPSGQTRIPATFEVLAGEEWKLVSGSSGVTAFSSATILK